MRSDNHSVLLASGGLDSTTLAYWLVERSISFTPVFIDYGQHCRNTELKTLKNVLPSRYANAIKVLNVSDIYLGSKSRLIDEANLWKDEVTYEDMYLPYRTLLLLSVGSAFAQAHNYSNLYSAFINSNHAQEIDCSAEFLSKLSKLLIGYGGVQLKMPFRDMSKEEVIRIGINLGVPVGQTYSCQASSKIPCGACPNCVDRLEAIKKIRSIQ